MILLSELSRISQGTFIQFVGDASISHMYTDTRTLSDGAGAVFFAIAGLHHDGHKYIGQAYDAGAKAFVIEKEIDASLFPEASFFQVKSSIRAMQELAAWVRSRFYYPVLGIAGSNGKTIIKEWLASMLGDQFVIVKSPKSYNSQIGVPLSVWGMQAHHTLAIFEAGISKPAEMAHLEAIIQPTLGIFTNIGPAHDEGFSSRQEKLAEKLQLFKNCPELIYCADQVEVSKAMLGLYPNAKHHSWSIHRGMGRYHVENNAGKISISSEGEAFSFPLKSNDASTVENTVHCVVAMLCLGLGEVQITAALEKIRPVKMRLEIKEGINQTYLIDDTYNNDLKGLEIALQFMAQQNLNKKRTVILSDIEQSGMAPDALYAQVNKLLLASKTTTFIGIGKELEKQNASFKLPSQFYEDVASFLHSQPKFQEETILIKGARSMNFEKIVAHLQRKYHGTYLEINLEALVHNLNYYRAKLDPATKVMVMVKALAYGSGSKEIAQVLQHHKVDYLGVVYVDEAIELREYGITLPILVMNPTPESFPLFAQYQLEPEMYSLSMLRQFIQHFDGEKNIPPVQLKMDTGMRRLGFVQEDIPELLQVLAEGKIKVSGIFSHLASADDKGHDAFTWQQVSQFEAMYAQIASAIGYAPLRHILNSPGITRHGQHQMDMVRLGIGLYGYDGDGAVQASLRSVGTLKTTISQIKQVKQGESVGYNRNWVAPTGSRVATIAIGYADGFRRAYGNGVGKVYINGQLVPVVGNVCMDMSMVDVSGVDCAEGDEVVIFGENPTITHLAKWCGTIPYEILTNVNSRVRRVFVSE